MSKPYNYNSDVAITCGNCGSIFSAAAKYSAENLKAFNNHPCANPPRMTIRTPETLPSVGDSDE